LGAQNYYRGRATHFPGTGAACYCCLLTRQRRRELLTLWESQVRPCWGNTEGPATQTYPSTPTMAAIVGAIQVELGLRRLGGPENATAEAITVQISVETLPKLEVFRIPLSRTCPFHTPAVSVVLVPGHASETTVEELLDLAAGGSHNHAVLVLDWPLCVRARCLGCGCVWTPMMRLAAFRRCGRCPRCGSRQNVEEESVRSVERHSKWAERTIAGLGLPENHLHSVRVDKNG
jgi:adenylyltransferase/sulfurtransferase